MALVVLAVAVFLVFGLQPWARGVALGGAASLINFLIMAGQVRRQGVISGGKGARVAAALYFLRMLVLAAALFYAFRSDGIAIWATIPSLFASQVVLVGEELAGGQE